MIKREVECFQKLCQEVIQCGQLKVANRLLRSFLGKPSNDSKKTVLFDAIGYDLDFSFHCQTPGYVIGIRFYGDINNTNLHFATNTQYEFKPDFILDQGAKCDDTFYWSLRNLTTDIRMIDPNIEVHTLS